MELDLPFPNRLENPHIISKDQIHVRVIGRGVSKKTLTSSYERRQNVEYFLELGNTLASLARVIPCGMLVFFPSYGVMATSIERWGGPASTRSFNKTNDSASTFFAARQRKSGSKDSTRFSYPRLATDYASKTTHSTPWKRLLSQKAVVIEPKSASDLPDAIAEFHKYLNLPKSKGVALFGVCRGKISEGIDFAHDMCRAVIITGLPFAPSFDPKVKMKRDFLDQNKARQNAKASTNGGFKGKNRNGTTFLSGHDWYTQQAHRAVNQAIGRVIRNKRDYGAIILMDSRFGLPGNQNGLSKWVRPHILPDEGFGQATQKLAQFYIKAKANEEKEGNQLMTNQNSSQKPTNVSMILKYEDEGKENNQLGLIADEADITKIAIIKKFSEGRNNEVDSKGKNQEDNYNDKSYIDPKRVIARVDMTHEMMGTGKDKLLLNLNTKLQPKSSLARQPCSKQKSRIISSVSGDKVTTDVQTKNLGSSTAAHFFQRVKSTVSRDELDSIKRSVVLMKKFNHQQHRKKYTGAARDVIQIILNYESFDNRCIREKPELLVSFLQLLPDYFVEDGEQLSMHITFRKASIRSELRSVAEPQEYMKLHMEFVILLREVWFEKKVRKGYHSFVEKLGKLLGRIVKCYKITQSSLTQFVNIVPSELQQVTTAIIDDILATVNVSKIQEIEEKLQTGEASVKIEHFRKSTMAWDEDKTAIDFNNARSSTALKAGDHDSGREINKILSDSQLDHQKTCKKMKITKNPYAKVGAIKVRPRPNTDTLDIKVSDANSINRERKRLSELLKTKKRAAERCDQDDELLTGRSVESIVRHSGSNTYTGSRMENTRQINSNVPKNLNCSICHQRLEKLYLSECNHMACLQCVS